MGSTCMATSTRGVAADDGRRADCLLCGEASRRARGPSVGRSFLGSGESAMQNQKHQQPWRTIHPRSRRPGGGGRKDGDADEPIAQLWERQKTNHRRVVEIWGRSDSDYRTVNGLLGLPQTDRHRLQSSLRLFREWSGCA